jgi:general secretion pathway protein K
VTRERGFALLLVLWTLVLLSLLVSALAAGGSGQARVAAALRRNAELDALAQGGVEVAMFHLMDRSRARWPADGRIHLEKRDGARLLIEIDNEAGKVNPNQAQPDLMGALLQAVGADRNTAAGLATAIVSWRRPNAGQVGLFPAGGNNAPDVTAAAYRSAGRPYAPPGQPFESLDELRLVLGMTPALFDRLRPHLSLYNSDTPDPSTADPVVRRALEIQQGGGAAGGLGGLNTLTVQNAPANGQNESVVSVWVDASDGPNRHALRHAIVSTSGGGNDGPPFAILRLDSVARPPPSLREPS